MIKKCALFFLLAAIQFCLYAGDFEKALARLENTVCAGYTVFSEDGSIKNPYLKGKFPLCFINAIVSDDVFLKVRSRVTGEIFFTKNLIFYIEDGFLRVSDEMILEPLASDENDFYLRKEILGEKTFYFMDLFYYEDAELPPIYSEDKKPAEYKRGFELELYKCGAVILEREGQYFQFAEQKRIYSDEIEKDCVCLSNVDVMAEFDRLEKNIPKKNLKIKRKLQKLKAHCLEYNLDNNEDFGAAWKISTCAKELRRILEKKGLIRAEGVKPRRSASAFVD